MIGVKPLIMEDFFPSRQHSAHFHHLSRVTAQQNINNKIALKFESVKRYLLKTELFFGHSIKHYVLNINLEQHYSAIWWLLIVITKSKRYQKDYYYLFIFKRD